MAIKDWKNDFPVMGAALEKTRLHNRTGQAYLFVGDTGDALQKFAMGWAMTAACQSPGADGSACGKCRNCRLFEAGAYSELLTLSPQSKSRIIKIDALREFDRHLWLTTPEGMLQTGIITDADCMTAEAQNALLKTLEEPPERTMILLLSCHPNLLLPTIRSRCQTILLLKNRTDYTQVASQEFLKALSTLRRSAGTRAAFTASAVITGIFDELRQKAEEYVDENWSPEFSEDPEADASMRKQMAELKEERIASEYLRMRSELIECIQAWFQQRLLLASALSADKLPQPEFRELMTAPGSIDEAEEDLRYVSEYLRALRANVDESLALDAFCLSVCKKTR